jgi:hypothetical protein
MNGQMHKDHNVSRRARRKDTLSGGYVSQSHQLLGIVRGLLGKIEWLFSFRVLGTGGS